MCGYVVFIYWLLIMQILCFFFNDTATTEIYTLSLHDALPISAFSTAAVSSSLVSDVRPSTTSAHSKVTHFPIPSLDRKSTRLNSSHANISYAVFCLKKKKNIININPSTYCISL